MSKLDEILGILGIVAQLGGSLIPGGAAIASLSSYLVKIAQAANAAHIAVAGKPIDLSLLTEEQHV